MAADVRSLQYEEYKGTHGKIESNLIITDQGNALSHSTSQLLHILRKLKSNTSVLHSGSIHFCLFTRYGAQLITRVVRVRTIPCNATLAKQPLLCAKRLQG